MCKMVFVCLILIIGARQVILVLLRREKRGESDAHFVQVHCCVLKSRKRRKKVKSLSRA